jgi:putative intracellular protease/amidase
LRKQVYSQLEVRYLIEVEMPPSEFKILFICTSCDVSSYGANTGVWLEEVAVPYYNFKEAGYKIEICSIAGSAPPIDPGSMSGSSFGEETQQFLQDATALEIFNNAPALSTVIKEGRLKSYACLFLVGGHGCLGDFHNNQDIKEAVEYFYADVGGCVAAICHGTLGLVHCQYQGEPLLKSKFVAVFSNEEEEWLGLLDVIKVRTEDAVDECGGIRVPCQPW